jgi:hypothetical protein
MARKLVHVEADFCSNHALYALFPLISTDVLTPFIDLMEDALIQQVPPIVVSGPKFPGLQLWHSSFNA